jgi:putative flippase GtrA
MSPAGHFTLLRVIPIIVLVAVALILQQGFGADRLIAAGVGLVAAIIVRIYLPRIWPEA